MSSPFPTEVRFCEGCEFAGNIPSNVSPQYAVVCKRDAVSSTALVDSRFNFSTGIVDLRNTKEAPSVEDIFSKLNEPCDETCNLKDSNFFPIEISDRIQMRATWTLLNSMPNIARFGIIKFSLVCSRMKVRDLLAFI